MYKEIEQGQQKLIGKIEQKLQQLRAERDLIERSKYPQPQPQRVRARPSSGSQMNFRKVNGQQKIDLKANLENLQKLYQAKKQLSKVGILTNNPTEIYKYRNDPKWTNYIQKKKQKMAVDQQRMKIINQQIANAQKFLKNKKISDKKLAELQEMHYSNILKQKADQFQKYKDLLGRSKLTRLEKEQILQMTFDMLKQWNKTVRKETLRQFLLANHEFCRHFLITHAEINRDLEVFEARQQGTLNYIEFVQFVKSIQITNPGLNPGLKQRIKQAKQKEKQFEKDLVMNMVSMNDKNKQSGLNSRQITQKLLDYLRKLFKNYDRAHESVIDRGKFIAAIEKGVYLDFNKQKWITIKQLKQFGSFVAQQTKQKAKTNYYKELDSKFINFGQIQQFCRQFCGQKYKNNLKQAQLTETQLTQKQRELLQAICVQQQQSESPLTESQCSGLSEVNLSSKEGKQLTEADYQRYGWRHTNQQKSVKIGLSQLDHYYGELSQKYGNQISWADPVDNFKADFKQLEAFIKLQEQKKLNQAHPTSHERLALKQEKAKPI